MWSSKILRKSVFAATTAVALGFGAQQALAAPGAASKGAYCTSSWAIKCDNICITKGYDYGMCQESGSCVCGFYPV